MNARRIFHWTRLVRPTCVLALALLCASGTTGGVHAQPPAGNTEIPFDIPAQPLADALVVYGRVTGLDIIADDALVSGRQSSAIKGVYAPEIALRQLVADAALAVRYVDAGTITLKHFPTQPAPATVNDPNRYESYSAALQAAVARALCGYSQTRPGYYRVAVRLWIGPTGTIEHSALLGGTGDPARDASLLKRLDVIHVGEARPAGLPQPATVLITPRSPEETGDCAPTKRASARR